MPPREWVRPRCDYHAEFAIKTIDLATTIWNEFSHDEFSQEHVAIKYNVIENGTWIDYVRDLKMVQESIMQDIKTGATLRLELSW